jgi:hypothetical protein
MIKVVILREAKDLMHHKFISAHSSFAAQDDKVLQLGWKTLRKFRMARRSLYSRTLPARIK